MKKILFFLCMAMFMNMPCFAEKFSVEHDDGNSNTTTITYEITSDNTVSVVSGESPYAGNIVIPENVTNNEIQYAVTAIGNMVFNGCTNLTSVTIPNSVVTIGSAAFQNCTHLATVQLGNSVKTISSYAFGGCDDLTSVELPNSLETIGTRAFQSCDKLESVSFGESIKSIQEATFSSCTSLNKVIFPNISTLFNIEFVSYSSNPLPIAKHIYVKDENGGETEVTDLVIPEGVTEIPNEFFKDVASITSITIPSSVTLIGDNAFAGCTNLATVTFPESSINMGKDVFANTAWISNHQSDDNVVYIGSVLYQYKGEMQENTTITVKNGTTSIAEGAFKNQTNLVNITIPESVTHIGKDAFTGTTWYDGLADGPVYINKVLYKYKGTMQANTTIEVTEGTVNIAEGAFENFTQLTKVVLPNSVTTLEKAAFSGCTGLSDLTIGDAIATIGDDAFKSCNNLSKIHVSSGDRMFGILYGDAISWGEGQANPFTLAKHLYVGDTEVTEVTLPEDMITEINQGFFHNFGKNVTSLTIPGSVTTIGDAAFQDWTNLVSVTIGESVESIGANAFKGCTKLESIEIPNSVLSIGERAFESCSALSNVTIGNGVETIGQYAFNSCSALTNITIGNSVKTIGNWAFNGCNNLGTVNVNTLLTVFNVERGNASNNPFSMVSKLCLNGEEITTELVIPEGVAEINNGFFYNFYKTIETVTISDSVKTIGQYAFQGWPALTTVTLGNSVDSIASGAFQNCSKLESITLGDSIAFVGTNAFSGCNSLQQVHVTNLDKWYAVQFGDESANPLTLAKHLYYNGNEVTSVVIPEGITEINQSFFKGYENIKSIVLPNSVVKIGDYAFSGLSNLESVTLSSSLETIGTSAFQNCTALTAIEIPNLVKSIGHTAFNGCTNLAYVTLGDSVKSIGDWAFDNCTSLQTVNVNKLETIFNIQYNGARNPFVVASKLHLNGEEVTDLVIPEGVTEIKKGFLYNFGNNVTSVTIPNSVKIGDYAFQNWPKLESVSLERTGKYAFEGCSALTSITLGASVDTIATGAFRYCKGLESVVIPNTVVTIEKAAFEGCTKLSSVTFGDAIASVGSYAFNGCDSLKRVDVTNLDTWYAINFENQSANPLTIAHHLYFNGEEVTGLNIPEGITEINEGFFKGYENIKSIVLPNSVVKIGDRAFKGLANLESVTLSSSLETIGTSAFQDCTALTAIEIPNSVKTFSADAFKGCTNLSSATLGDSIRTLGAYSFSNCINLDSIVIPNSVATLEDGVFLGCTKLSYVSLGDSVKYAGHYVFDRCDSLQTVNVNNLEIMYNIQYGGGRNGNPFNLASKLLLKGKEVTELVIPENLTTINNGFFYNFYKNVTSVIIPNSVETIGGSAFLGWPKLVSVSIGDSVTTIGSNAFWGCPALVSVSVGNSVKTIEGSCFSGCTNLESIKLGESLQTIGSNAFENCSNLKSIIIPNSVISIGDWIFWKCENLSSVELGNSLQAISGGAFQGCINLKTIVIPNSVVSIGSQAFKDCTNLSYITIGDSVKSTGMNAFDCCNNIQTVNVNNLATIFNIKCDAWGNPFSIASKLHLNGKEVTDLIIPEGVTEIKNGFFYKFGENVTSVTIPNSVKTIGDRAFDSWEKLTSAHIGDSVTTIGGRSFRNCTSLDSVYIGNSVEAIGGYAFEKCSALTSITMGSSVISIEYYAFANCTSLDSVHISNSVKTIGGSAFERCSALTSVTLGNSVDSIGYDAFRYTALTSVEMPHSVRALATSVFRDCPNLKSVTLSNSLKTIPESTFQNCPKLSNITLGESVNTFEGSAFNGCDSLTINVTKLETLFNDFKFDGYRSNPFEIAKKLYVNNEEIVDLVVPNTVKKIPGGVFNGSKIESLVIPNSVETIGNNAFSNCKGLTSLEIPNSVKMIGEDAFNSCEKLTILSLGNSIDTIGAGAFYYCKALTSVEIPNSVKMIGENAFKSCENLSSVTLGESLQNIGSAAFAGCSSLASIEIPNSVTTISREAFANCNNLSSAILGNKIQSISERAFVGCSALTSIEIPNSVTTIAFEAFYDCYELESVTLGSSIQSIDQRAFGYGDYPRTYLPSVDWLFKVDISPILNDRLFGNMYIGKQPLTALEVPNDVVNAPILSQLYNSCITSLNTGNGLKTLPEGRSEKITNLTLGSNLSKIEGEFPNALIVVSNASKAPTITEKTFPKCSSYTLDETSGVVVLLTPEAQKDYSKALIWEDMSLTNQSNKVDVLVNTPGELSFEIIDKHEMAPAKVVGLTVRGEINDDDFTQMNKNMKSLLYLDLSNAKVNKVPDNAFDGKQQLLSLQLPSTTKVVGNYAFQGCHGIEELVLPTDLTEIGDGAFAGTNIETLEFNYALQKIGNRAFAYTPLKEISFQNKVESIGREAFQGCNLTQELYFSETLTSIGERAFEGQNGITGHLTIPESVTTVGQRAFSGTNISTVFISGKMTTLESGVFANCPQLNVVYIPDNITRINASAFQGCTSLKDLRLSQKVEEIEREAFRAIPIRSVSVPENVKTLREYTFADCANLRFATLPSTITSLEDGVFYNCRQLMNLTVKALTPPTVKATTFRGVNTDRCIVSIPTESYKEYVLAEYWGRFIQMRNDIAVQKKGNGTISFASGETAEEGNTPAPVTRATRAATDETESTVTTVEDGSSLYVPKDGTVRFYITPEEGEEIVSATFDGEDITSQIVDGVFVTTADKKSAELVVNFSELTKTAQVITWNQEFEQPVMVGDKITLNAAASSGLSVNFAFGNNESSQFANLNDNTLAIVKPGAIALIAQQKGDDEYASISTDVKYIQAYEYGDANGNREINSADLATTIDYAIGNDPQEFLFRAADVNKDQRVNVADVSGVVDIVLTAPATIDEAELMTRSTGEVLRGEMSANGLNVTLSSNMGEYLTFQCDIRLSDDCLPKLDEAGNPVVTLRNSEAAGTQVAVARFVEEGCIRMLLYSTDNTPMTNNQTLTLQMESVSKNGDIEIENAGYSFRENEAIVYRPFEYGFVTGMEGLEDVISSMKIKTQGEEISIYSPVDYQLPVTSVDGIVHMLDVKAGYNKFALKQGVYIIGKNKVIIK